MSELERLRRSLDELIQRKELAAAIIHLNDTYRIEERLPGIPGFPRVATLINEIRTKVREGVGEDRTLVVHAGDFLSPSLINRVLDHPGKAMIGTLNACGVNFVTPGNHEFDLKPRFLKARLAEAKFKFVASNLKAPAGFSNFTDIALWPKRNPFLAIGGFAGRQTIDKALELKFRQKMDWEKALKTTVDAVRNDIRIGAFIALTHMDRDEDKAFQERLGRLWHRRGFAYVLGGHDHDINWYEFEGRSTLCKNLSNCGTVTVVLLPKAGLASVPASLLPARKYLNRARFHALENAGRDGPMVQSVIKTTVSGYRKITRGKLRPDFQQAFQHCIRSTVEHLPSLAADGVRGILDFATAVATDGPMFESAFVLASEVDISSFTPEPRLVNKVTKTLNELDQKTGITRTQVIRSFPRDADGAAPQGLDGRESKIRSHSTDYGNFIADAVKIAAGADLALINSGSLRIDDFVGFDISNRTLRETVLFDRPGAIAMVILAPEDLEVLCAHSIAKAGEGAFLQTSESVDGIRGRTEKAKVAITRYLLDNAEDGYQQKLADLRRCSLRDLPRKLRILPSDCDSKTMVELIIAGASRVSYSNAVRMSGERPIDLLAKTAVEFADRIDQYLQKCQELGIDAHAARALLEIDSSRDQPGFDLREARWKVRLFVITLAFWHGKEWVREDLYAHLRRGSRLRHQRRVPYHDYLDKAMTLLEMSAMMRLLRDEEPYSDERAG